MARPRACFGLEWQRGDNLTTRRGIMARFSIIGTLNYFRRMCNKPEIGIALRAGLASLWPTSWALGALCQLVDGVVGLIIALFLILIFAFAFGNGLDFNSMLLGRMIINKP